jgi:hypothetical protein
MITAQVSLVEEILANPMYLAAGGLAIILIGVLAMKFLSGSGASGVSTKVSFQKSGGKPTGSNVLLLRPRDHRFMSIPVDIENSRVLLCKKIDKIARRFYKAGPGWTNPEARQTMFLGVDGYGYVANIKKPDAQKFTLKETLIELWTKEFYEKVPKPYRDVIETSEYGLIVDVSIPEESDEMPFKSSESLDEEDRSKMLHELANPEEKVPLRRTLMPILFGFTAGIALVLLIQQFQGG